MSDIVIPIAPPRRRYDVSVRLKNVFDFCFYSEKNQRRRTGGGGVPEQRATDTAGWKTETNASAHLQQDAGVEAVGAVVVVDVYADGVQILQRAVHGRVEREPEVLVQRVVPGLHVEIHVLTSLPHDAAVRVHALRPDRYAVCDKSSGS